MFQEIDLALLHFFNGSQSAIFDQFILTLTNGLTWIPLYIALFVMVLKNNESMSQIFIIVGCCAMGVIFSAGVDDLLVKPLVGRPRPAQDLAIKYTIDTALGYRESGFSFFSAHAANTFTLAIYMIFLVRNRAFTIAMVLWSLLNCYTRLYLGVHYPSDILCGLLFGTAVGSIAYWIHLRLYYKVTPHFRYVSEAYTKTGYSIGDIDMVIATLVLTLIYALFKSVLSV
ncbi:MAG: phosphatase PAP2 family protein [Prevotella sp.]|nr:phosphatase PAP2 family protein [Prevotella sp.]MBP3219530.1 phosphatase PAP2 family protein [Prevotella sp.]